MINVEYLIARAGGISALANKLGIHHTCVLDWRVSGWIPGQRVTQISKALDIPTDKLLKLVKPPGGPPKKNRRRTRRAPPLVAGPPSNG